MTIHVRQAQPNDAATIATFNALLAQESEGKQLDLTRLQGGVAALLADPHKGYYFIAEEDGKIIGQLAVTFEWSDWRNGWFYWIQSVYVPVEQRRRGIFRSLFEHVQQLARHDPQVIGLRLYVEQGHAAAQETYARLGMKPAGYFVLEKYPL